jgi:hypothetical protein
MVAGGREQLTEGEQTGAAGARAVFAKHVFA